METLQVNQARIIFPDSEQKAAELLCEAVDKTDALILESWGLHTPDDLHIIIMTSWREFLTHAPPKKWQLIITLLSPILNPRFERLWPHIGGWEQRFGSRRTVGLKPPELLQSSNSTIGEAIFIAIDDSNIKFQLTACHELTHAYSEHLNLPAWLKEGIAMMSVDRYIGGQTVRQSTLEKLVHNWGIDNPHRYRIIRALDPDEMIYFYIKSYWTTRLIEETQPGLIRSLLVKRLTHKELEIRLAAAYNNNFTEFWNAINQRAIKLFREE